ncbi:Pmp-4 [Aphelenchoides fujianensis]|nr:Pmp-4 [Aphelenchoides fujianensis]
MLKWFAIAIPATLVNSLIRFFDSYIGLAFRQRLTRHAYAKYFKSDVYYKVSNIDTRLLNVDQCLTEDISTLSTQVAHLYSQITKPLFDIALITVTLINYARRREVGSTIMFPVVLAIVLISATARILKMVSPR